MICPALYDINLLRDFWKVNIFKKVLQEIKSANSLIKYNKIDLVTQNKEAAWCHYQVLLWTSPQTHQAQGQAVKNLQLLVIKIGYYFTNVFIHSVYLPFANMQYLQMFWCEARWSLETIRLLAKATSYGTMQLHK